MSLWIKYELVDFLSKVVIATGISLILSKGWILASSPFRRLYRVAKHLLLISQFANAVIVAICMSHDWRLRLCILLYLLLAVSLSILSMHVHPDIHQQHIVLTLALKFP